MDSERRSRLEATWHELGVDVTELAPSGDGSLGRTIPRGPVRAAALSDDRADGVELGPEIGRGGMGIVFSATQKSLGREVAVKTIRPELSDAEALELLAEARITGALEHPAIVPIYAVSADAAGRPLILMKRLTGESWHERIRELGSRRDATLLDEDIGVLAQVCNAVAFAHERGIIHRDIKPANILLGDFGEVYLVDWGLAADFADVGIAGLPHVSSLNGISGSVFYMAPEQALGVGGDLGPHTDVYLLGATLFELVTGQSVRGDSRNISGKQNFHELLIAAYTDEPPQLPLWAPSELRSICEKALARVPSERFRTVRAFRNALLAYLSHRESRQLETEAQGRLEKALALQADECDDGGGRDLAAARFGFEQALRGWPQNQAAKRGRDATLLASAEREILARRPEQAALLLAELESSASERMSADIGKLREKLDDERRRAVALERAARESDLGLGVRLWRGFGLAFGLVFLVAHLVMAGLSYTGTVAITQLAYLATTSSIAACIGTAVLFRRHVLFPNRASRRFAFTLVVMLLAQVAVFSALWWLGIDLPAILGASLIQLSGSLAIKTSLLDRRVLWTSVFAVAMGGVAFALPALALVAVGLAYAAYFVSGALLTFNDEPGATGQLLIEDLRRLN